MANIIAGLTKLPLAKILDTWGRPQGMSLMLLIWVLGYIMYVGHFPWNDSKLDAVTTHKILI